MNDIIESVEIVFSVVGTFALIKEYVILTMSFDDNNKESCSSQ